MAISITPQRFSEDRQPKAAFSFRGGGGMLFIASVLFLVAVLGSWAGLLGFLRYLEGAAEQKEAARVEVVRSRSGKAETAILATVQRVGALRGVLRAHLDGRKGLAVLEERVQPGVSFANLHIDYRNATVKTEILAPNFTAVAQQIIAFERDASVRRVEASILSRASLETSIVRASVLISFAEDAFRADARLK